MVIRKVISRRDTLLTVAMNGVFLLGKSNENNGSDEDDKADTRKVAFDNFFATDFLLWLESDYFGLVPEQRGEVNYDRELLRVLTDGKIDDADKISESYQLYQVFTPVFRLSEDDGPGRIETSHGSLHKPGSKISRSVTIIEPALIPELTVSMQWYFAYQVQDGNCKLLRVDIFARKVSDKWEIVGMNRLDSSPEVDSSEDKSEE